MSWRCKECNMTFDTQLLYDTHKRKFCVGNGVDPAHIHSRISGKGANSIERKDKDLIQSPFPDIRSPVHSSLSAPNTPYRPMNPFPDSDRSTIFRGSRQHHGRHQSAPNTPSGSDYSGISALEREKIEQLKRFKTHQQLQRNSRNLEEKLLLSSIKDYQSHTPRRTIDEDIQRDDRIFHLNEIHQQQLAELKLRNERLQEEKAKIAERMNSLGLTSRHKLPSQGSVDKQATELDGLKRFLDFKEEEERRKFNEQQSKANLLKVSSRSPPLTAASAASEFQKPSRRPSRESERYGRGQLIPYYQSPVRYFDQAPMQFGQNNILHDLNMLKSEYFQKGGHDPAILAQIRELEIEAQRMQASQRPPPPVANPFLQQQIMSFHMANQRLEQELQLLRAERNQKERGRSPDVDPEFKRLKEEHLVKMASLRQEAELLKQQAEVEKMRRELKELRGEKPLAEENKKVHLLALQTEGKQSH